MNAASEVRHDFQFGVSCWRAASNSGFGRALQPDRATGVVRDAAPDARRLRSVQWRLWSFLRRTLSQSANRFRQTAHWRRRASDELERVRFGLRLVAGIRGIA